MSFRWFGVLFAALAAPVAWGEVTLHVFSGAGGLVRHGAMAPVHVIAINDAEDRSGRIAAGFQALGAAPAAWATHDLALPPQAQKAVTLYLEPPLMADTLVVRYESATGQPVTEVRDAVQTVAAGWPVVAIVGDRLPPGFPPAETGGKAYYSPVFLQQRTLPDRHEGLELFDAVVFSPGPEAPLSRSQATALLGWVLRGGALVIDASARSDAFHDEGLAALMPFVPLSETQADLDVFGEAVPLALGPVDRGAALLESNGHPLVVRRTAGLGTVTCVAVPLEHPVWTRWAGTRDLWPRAIPTVDFDTPPEASGLTFQAFGSGPDSATVSALSNLVTGEAPVALRLWIVLLLTALYAFAVGPGDYLLVRRLGKPHLTWITFPAMVLVFTVAAYWGAHRFIGGDLASHHLERVVVFPDEQASVVTGLYSVFAPRTATYQITHADKALLRPLGTGLQDSRLDMDQSGRILNHRIPIWTWRAYAASETTAQDFGLGLKATRDPETGVWDIQIHNDSPWVLRDIRVIHLTIGNHGAGTFLPPGEVAALSIEPGAPRKVGNPWGGSPWDGFAVTAEKARGVMREFDTPSAVARGAMVLSAKTDAHAPNPLIINGEAAAELPRDPTALPRLSDGERTILVVMYPDADPVAAGEE